MRWPGVLTLWWWRELRRRWPVLRAVLRGGTAVYRLAIERDRVVILGEPAAVMHTDVWFESQRVPKFARMSEPPPLWVETWRTDLP